MTGGAEVLRMEGITKRFQDVIANDAVSIVVRAGEVRAILGENGAGKSSLLKVLGGLYRPDAGEICIMGRPVRITSPRAAYQLGVGIVHQHFMLVRNLTVVENVVLGIRTRRLPLVDLASARLRLHRLSREYGLDVDPDAPVWQLSVGEQQRVELLKALFREVRIVALDEPTAVLRPEEVETLFRVIRRLASRGVAIIFISHKLEEVRAISHTITVLRNGRVVGESATSEISQAELATLMIGREPTHADAPPRVASGKPVLVVQAASCRNDRGAPALTNVSLTADAGEIVGVAGVEGNGQRELAECIAGLRPLASGRITIAGTAVRGVVRDPALLGFIPEDRHQTGLVLGFTVAENLVLRRGSLAPFVRRGLIRWAAIRQHADDVLERFDIRRIGAATPVGHLSGGNQQRVVLARETSGARALIVAAQASRGLDIAAVEAVHRLLIDLRARGSAILYISSDLSELLALCDRLLVLLRGTIVGEVPADPALRGRIGEMMMGRGSDAVH